MRARGAPIRVLWLGEPACADPSRVGGKAARLSSLAAGHRVPPGFCIPASPFGAEAPAEPGPSKAPAELVDAVRTAYSTLGRRCGADDPPVAVRSSALDEDGTRVSFAGQYETIIGVVGLDSVIEAVLRCRTSAASERVAGYRKAQAMCGGGDTVAVLVQQLIAADIAAVAFSANPVTGDRGEVVINASWGLGESIVGGSVTPDTYIVRKADWTVVRRTVAMKRRMTVPVPGGSREVEVPLSLQAVPVLDDERAGEIARLAGALEATTGLPADVECAYEARTLYLLQCRPITTLSKNQN